MVFLNRAQELDSLEALFDTPSAKLCRLYGRRRLGKTALLLKAREERGGLFLTVPEQTPSGILHALNAQLQRETGRPLQYDTLEELLEDLPNHGPRLVVLDEFHRLRDRFEDVEGTLQRVWDHQLQDTGIILVLCGSVIGMMAKLNAATAPLHGRFAWDLHLEPFSYGAVRLFYPEASEEERVARYAVFGATPHYHRLSHQLPLEEAIERLFLADGAPLKEEPRLLLELELRKPDRYQEILEALGAGRRTLGEVANLYGERHSAYTPYVAKLRDELGILRSDDPLHGKQRSKRIHLSDPFFHCYYRFIYPNLARLDLGDLEGVMAEIERDLPAHIGRPGFEEVGRQTLQTLNGEVHAGQRFAFTELGAWWDGQEELDAVAVGRDAAYALEAKFTSSPFTSADLEVLLRRAELFGQACNRSEVVPIALSRSGFSPQVEGEIEEGMLVGWTLEDVEAIHEGRA